MSRPKESHKKVDVSRPTTPLQHNPFAVLGELDALKNIPSAPEPKKPPQAPDPGKTAKAPKGVEGQARLRRLV